MKKFIVLCLSMAFITAPVTSFAAETGTPEMRLLESVTALSGQVAVTNGSKEGQKAMFELLQAYAKTQTADPGKAIENIRDAAAAMGISTTQFEQTMQVIQNRLDLAQSKDITALKSDLAQDIANSIPLLQVRTGAQYNSKRCHLGTGLLVASAIFAWLFGTYQGGTHITTIDGGGNVDTYDSAQFGLHSTRDIAICAGLFISGAVLAVTSCQE
jgi:hypothetical protein